MYNILAIEKFSKIIFKDSENHNETEPIDSLKNLNSSRLPFIKNTNENGSLGKSSEQTSSEILFLTSYLNKKMLKTLSMIWYLLYLQW